MNLVLNHVKCWQKKLWRSLIVVMFQYSKIMKTELKYIYNMIVSSYISCLFGPEFDSRHLHYGGLAQLARALRLHRRGHQFESDILHFIDMGMTGFDSKIRI